MEEEIIEEGLRFFKTSEKLFKVFNKLTEQAKYVEDVSQKKEIITAATKLNSLAQAFQKVEMDYASGNRSRAKIHYDELLNKYKDIGVMLKRESVKNALKKANSFAVSIASLAVSYIVIVQLSKIGLISSGVSALTSETKTKDILADVVKKLGILYLSRLPILAGGKFIDNKIENISDQNKILDYCKKSFKELS